MSRPAGPAGRRRPTGAERKRREAEAIGVTGDAADLLAPFLVDGRLPALPARRRKRLAVLDLLAAQFEPGHVYHEPDVNLVLRRFSDDTASLRRALVDEEFMERRDNFYWRAGGTFEVD
jgi:hypothetical protein